MTKKVSYSQGKIIAPLLVFIFLFMSILWAGTTGKIAGLVTDQATGDPLPGANVIIENTAKGASADEAGFFYILNVPPGNYSVKAGVIGYEAMTISNIAVAADRTTNVNFDLRPTVLEGEEVVVTAERPIVEHAVTGSEIVMDVGYIERAPIFDLNDALDNQTGTQNTGATTFIRGGLSSELNYILDGASLNSGIIGDNYQRLNMSAIQEISIMTGGYNAEYGQAMSGIVNVITREASTTKRGIHGSFEYRMRPAGKYHWASNYYSEGLPRDNYDLEHWTLALADDPARFADYFNTYVGPGTSTNNAKWDGTTEPTAQEIYDLYQQQTTPNPIMGDYAERSQQEFEGSVYGSLMDNMSFLVSGRYLRGVNIFPQAEEYNPEYNVQVKLDYHFSPERKLSLNVLKGWYKTAGYSESNWNNMETSQEARWQENAMIEHPESGRAFAPWGGIWQKGPQEKNFLMASLTWHHTLSPATFYNVQASFLSDITEEYTDYSKMTEDLSVVGWGSSQQDLTGRFLLNSRAFALGNYSESNDISLKGDLVSQVSPAHQLKTGAEAKLYNLDYVHYWFENSAGDAWHLDNVWDGKPIDISVYFQDKIEYPGSGIIANIGLRFDAFNANKSYPASILDPLGIQPWNGGDGVRPSNLDEFWPAHQLPIAWFEEEHGDLVDVDYRDQFPSEAFEEHNTVDSEWKMAIAPRLGISFPMTATSKLRFNYGHFYQRPSFTKLMGFPISWQENDPYNTARMDQWLGWCGNPGLTYEQTIQYEIGYTQSILDLFRLDIAAFYKDASKLTRYGFASTYSRDGSSVAGGWGPETFSTAHSDAAPNNNNAFYTNNAFRDNRGVELTFEKLFDGVWSARAVVNYGLNTSGINGYWRYDEDTTLIHQPHSFSEEKSTWLSSTTIKGDVSYMTPGNLGPAGLLGGIAVSLYYEWFQGPEYTYYPLDYTELQRPNNKRWFAHQNTDLKLTKRFDLAGFTTILGLEVYNLFDNYTLRMLSGNDLRAWEEDDRPPQQSVDVLREGFDELQPVTVDDDWWFYNSMAQPRRMLYLTLGVEL